MQKSCETCNMWLCACVRVCVCECVSVCGLASTESVSETLVRFQNGRLPARRGSTTTPSLLLASAGCYILIISIFIICLGVVCGVCKIICWGIGRGWRMSDYALGYRDRVGGMSDCTLG